MGYVKSLFTNIQKKKNMLKIAYFLKNLQTSRVNNSRIFRIRLRNFQGIVCILTETYWEIFKSALVYLSETY